MPLKRQLTHLKKAKKLVKLGKIKNKSETLIEDTPFLLENKCIKSSWVPRNHTSYYKNYV